MIEHSFLCSHSGPHIKLCSSECGKENNNPPIPWATVTDKIQMKNWKAIAEVRNQQLRLTLISAQGETEEGLSKGFPQYFLAEGVKAELPEREKILSLVCEAKQLDKVLEILKEIGVPHQPFGFEGTCRGSVDGLSYAKEGYHTNNYGRLEYFYRSTKKLGDEVEYEGATWMVVWNGGTSGSPETPDYHTLVIVPVASLTA